MEPRFDDVTFGPLEDADFAGISRLITRMSDHRGIRLRDKSEAYYRWMYLANPAGPAVVHSARLDGEVVASFAVAPKRFQVGGERVTVGKTMDMFTDPAFQGKGLMARCTTEVFDRAEEAGMAGWCVTPSVHSYPIFTRRWGYDEDLHVIYRARILRYAPVLAAMLKPAWLGRAIGRVAGGVARLFSRTRAPVEVEPLEDFGEEADRLWAEVGPGYPVAIVRDAAYLQWRYVANPDQYTILGLRRDGHLMGIVVLAETVRRGVRVGEVVDFVCGVDDDTTFRQLIDAAIHHSRARGHALVQAWSIRSTALDRRIRGAGLRLRRTDVKFLTSPGLRGMADPDAWLLTQGDGNDV
ncbi:MAG: GNAT family N-acetyltransferase [Propionibacterium sp.]|nr:GNAT family N-acetyltransferase [Propionibacterium sp.]